MAQNLGLTYLEDEDDDENQFEKIAQEEVPSQRNSFSPDKIAASERAERLDKIPTTPGDLPIKAVTPRDTMVRDNNQDNNDDDENLPEINLFENVNIDNKRNSIDDQSALPDHVLNQQDAFVHEV